MSKSLAWGRPKGGPRSVTVVQDEVQKLPNILMVEERSRWNIKLYTIPESQRGRSSVGIGCHPLSRVVCFSKLHLNRTPHSEKGSAGVFALWLAFVVFISAGPGSQRVSDAATGHQCTFSEYVLNSTRLRSSGGWCLSWPFQSWYHPNSNDS